MDKHNYRDLVPFQVVTKLFATITCMGARGGGSACGAWKPWWGCANMKNGIHHLCLHAMYPKYMYDQYSEKYDPS